MMRKFLACLVSAMMITNIFASLSASVSVNTSGLTSAATSLTNAATTSVSGSVSGSTSISGSVSGGTSSSSSTTGSTTTSGTGTSSTTGGATTSGTGTTASGSSSTTASASTGTQAATSTTTSTTQTSGSTTQTTSASTTTNASAKAVATKPPNDVAKNGGEAKVGYVDIFINADSNSCIYKLLNIILYLPEGYQKLLAEAYTANKDKSVCFDKATVEAGMKAVNEQIVDGACKRFSTVNDNIGNSLSCLTSVNVAADAALKKKQASQASSSAQQAASTMTSAQASTAVSGVSGSGSKLRNLSVSVSIGGTAGVGTAVSSATNLATSTSGSLSGSISTSTSTSSTTSSSTSSSTTSSTGAASTSGTSTTSGAISATGNTATTATASGTSGSSTTSTQGTTSASTQTSTTQASGSTTATASSSTQTKTSDKTANSVLKFQNGMQESSNKIDKARSALNSKIAKTVTDLQVWQAGRQKVLTASLDMQSKCGTLDANGQYTGFCFGNDDVNLLTKLVLDLGASFKNFNKVFTENTKTMKSCAANLATLFDGNCSDVIPLASVSNKPQNSLPVVVPAKKTRRILTATGSVSISGSTSITGSLASSTTGSLSASTTGTTSTTTGTTASATGTTSASTGTTSSSTGTTTSTPTGTTATATGSGSNATVTATVNGVTQTATSSNGTPVTVSLTQSGSGLTNPCSLCNGSSLNQNDPAFQAAFGFVLNLQVDAGQGVSALDYSSSRRNLATATTTASTTASASSSGASVLAGLNAAFDNCPCKAEFKAFINESVASLTAATIDFEAYPIPEAVKNQCNKFATANKANSNANLSAGSNDISACLGAKGGCMPMPQLYLQCTAYTNGQDVVNVFSNLLTGCAADADYTVVLSNNNVACTGTKCPTLTQPTSDANTTAMLGTKFWVVGTCSKGAYSIVSYQEHPNFGKSFDCANSDTDKALIAEFKLLDQCAGTETLTEQQLAQCGFPPGSGSCLQRLNNSCDNIGFDYYSEQFANSDFEGHCFNECAPALLNNADAAKAKANKEACFKVIVSRFFEATFLPKYSAWEMFTDVCKSHNMGCVFFDELKVETNKKCPWYDILGDASASASASARANAAKRQLATASGSVVVNDSVNSSITPIATTSTTVDPNKATISGSTSTKVATSSGISSTASKKATTVAKDSSFIKIAAGLLGFVLLLF